MKWSQSQRKFIVLFTVLSAAMLAAGAPEELVARKQFPYLRTRRAESTSARNERNRAFWAIPFFGRGRDGVEKEVERRPERDSQESSEADSEMVRSLYCSISGLCSGQETPSSGSVTMGTSAYPSDPDVSIMPPVKLPTPQETTEEPAEAPVTTPAESPEPSMTTPSESPEPSMTTPSESPEPSVATPSELPEPSVATPAELPEPSVTTPGELPEPSVSTVEASAEPSVSTVEALPEASISTVEASAEPSISIVEASAEPSASTLDVSAAVPEVSPEESPVSSLVKPPTKPIHVDAPFGKPVGHQIEVLTKGTSAERSYKERDDHVAILSADVQEPIVQTDSAPSESSQQNKHHPHISHNLKVVSWTLAGVCISLVIIGNFLGVYFSYIRPRLIRTNEP